MEIITSITALRQTLRQWRQANEAIALVPTMGNLHAGHLALVAAAKQQAKRVVVSIFVNPTQFGEGEDFANYPRTELADAEKLLAAGVDVIFQPSITEIYPEKSLTTVHVAEISAQHCGAARVGHFDGVATVVCKLFNMVQPDKAFFGEKDFQQLAVIRTMVKNLNIAVEVVSVAIVREPDGLAMSSRNGYLSALERKQAPLLYQTLCWFKRAV